MLVGQADAEAGAGSHDCGLIFGHITHGGPQNVEVLAEYLGEHHSLQRPMAQVIGCAADAYLGHRSIDSQLVKDQQPHQQKQTGRREIAGVRVGRGQSTARLLDADQRCPSRLLIHHAPVDADPIGVAEHPGLITVPTRRPRPVSAAEA